MGELDLFRDFRSSVAAPSGDARRRASAALAGSIDRKRTPGAGGLRRVTKRPGYSALVLAALAGATAAALFASTPWRNSPAFLERAQAALAADPGRVLHAIWEETWTSAEPTCSVARGPNESWIDQTPPHRFRAVIESSSPGDAPHMWACSSGTIGELRGTLDSRRALWFVPPGAKTGSPVWVMFEYDPVKALREAISAGRAHDEGETQFAGRTVKRIRVDRPPDCDDPCPHEPSYFYVDPDSFYPVAQDGFWSIWLAPSQSSANDFPKHAPPTERLARFRVVRRYLTFEYLPRSSANLALTGRAINRG